jgi:hypothetical protein
LYFPPKGTAGFGRRMVMGLKRSPFPPASTMASVFLVMFPAEYIVRLLPSVIVATAKVAQKRMSVKNPEKTILLTGHGNPSIITTYG